MSGKVDRARVKKTLDEMSSGEKRLLLALQQADGAEAAEVQESGGFNQLVEVMNAASWLESKGMVRLESRKEVLYTLAKKSLAGRDLPERRALKHLMKTGGIATLQDMTQGAKLSGQEGPIAIGWLKRKGWATIRKEEGETVVEVTPKGEGAADTRGRDERMIVRLSEETVPASSLDEGGLAVVGDLKGRKEIVREQEKVARHIHLTDGGRAALEVGVKLKMEITQLTPELIQTGRWRNADFRRYDIQTFAPGVDGGRPHPLTLLIDDIREIFLSMGFTEITGDFVDSCFWNMDALFIPQDHPARELQDTMYMEEPAKLSLAAEEEDGTLDRIRAVHESGGDTGSRGWGYTWDRSKAGKAILRTHTTVNTIRHLATHDELPIRVFSVEKAFRKEAIDSTHLPEFFQIEGIVVEEGASFDMLVGLLKEFYRRMGYTDIRLRGGYFPYTEPSMEVEVLLNGRWMELGGSGIFRPEVTEPFGIREPVLAWGLGLERLAMLRLGVNDIRDLYVSDLDWLRSGRLP